MSVIVPLICAFLVASPFTSFAGEPILEQRILLSDFSSTDLSPLDLERLVAELSDSLSREPSLSVIDSETRATALRELEFTLSGAASGIERIRLGSLLSATHIVTGSIGRTGSATWLINIQMLNAQTSEIEKSTSRSYPSLALLLADIRDTVASLLYPNREIPSGYVVITPASQRTFYYFPVRYVFLRNENIEVISLHSVGLGFQYSIGRPWGVLFEMALGYPLSISSDGSAVPVSALELPFLMEGAVGALWTRSASSRLLLSGAVGARFAEFLHGQLDNVGVFLDIGPFVELSLLRRFKLMNYAKASLGATLYPHVLQISDAIEPEGSGFAVTLSIAFGFGRN